MYIGETTHPLGKRLNEHTNLTIPTGVGGHGNANQRATEDQKKSEGSYLNIIELTMYVCGWPCGNRLLERLMSPSQKSQVMFASAFS